MEKISRRKFLKQAAMGAGALALGGMFTPGCGGIGPQLDFGENTEQIVSQMTEAKALSHAIMEYIENEKLLENLAKVSIENDNNNRSGLSKEEVQVTAIIKEIIKENFAKDIVSKEMPFTTETFNKRCDNLKFHFGNFIGENTKKGGFISYPYITIALAVDGNKKNSWNISRSIIHELGHSLGIQLESMTELFTHVYVGTEPINAPSLKATNKKGDRSGLINKYDAKVEIALKNKVGLKECMRAALTSPKTVKNLWNNNMSHIMNYDKIKKLNDNLKTDTVSSKVFAAMNIKHPSFTEKNFTNDGNALLCKILGLSEYNYNDPNTVKGFPGEIFTFDGGVSASMKVYAFDNPLLQDIPLKDKKNLDKGGFLVTRDLSNNYCKEGLDRYVELFNVLTRSAETTASSDIISNIAPPIELDR